MANSRLGQTGVLGESLSFPSIAPDDSYNLKVGPFDVSLVGGLGTTYNDNINLSERNRMSDIIISPSLELAATWPMTEYNTLRIGVGMSYSKYINHPEADSRGPILTPDSNTGFDFDILAGDFRFVVYDHISYQQDPIDNGSLSNTTSFGRFVNTAGVHGNWDLNDVQLAMGVAQQNWMSTENTFGYLDRSSQILDGSATFQLGPATFVGLQASTALTNYDQNVQNNNLRFSVGPFMRTKLTNYLDFNAGAGFELGDFQKGGTNGDSSNLSSYSLYAGLTHRLNRHISHSLSIGRYTDLGTYSNYTESWRIEHHASWSVLNNVSLGTNCFMEFADDSGGLLADSYTRYGGGISVGYRLTSKLISTLSYNYIRKDSNLIDRNYYQNAIGLDFRYNF